MKLTKNLGYLLVIYILISKLQAQTIYILDSKDLHPISGAMINLDHQSETLISNEKGELNILPNRVYSEIHITHWNYKPMKLTKEDLEKKAYKIYLHQNLFSLEEVIVSANKKETQRSDLSVQTLSVNSSQIQFLSPATSAELMQATGEIQVQKSQQGGGSPVIRGFEANKILLVVDGIRMNNAIFRGGHLQNIITMDPSIVEKTEVIFGPSSVIYGSDALGGVIHFYTKSPKLAINNDLNFRTDALVKYASVNDEKTIQLGFNIGLKSVASFTALSFSDFGDLRQGNVRDPFYGDWGKRLFYSVRMNGRDTMLANGDENLQKQSAYKQYNLMQKFLWVKDENQSHLLNLQYSTSTDVPRYDRLTEENSSGVLRNAEWYYGPQKRVLSSYVYSRKSNATWLDKCLFNLAYQHVEESRHNRSFNSSSLNHRTERVDILSLNLDLFKDIRKHAIQYGLEYNYNKVNSTAFRENILDGTIEGLDTRYPDGGSVMSTWAIFLSHQWKHNNKLILNNGLRFTSNRLTSEFKDKTFFPFSFNNISQQSNAISASTGVVYKPFKTISFPINISSGFRAPNVDDLAKVFESVSGTLIVPNPDLRPEYVYTAEIGIHKIIESTHEISLVGYYTIYDNVITTQNSTLSGMDSVIYNGVLSRVISQQNGSSAFLYGLSAKLKLNFNDHWAITSNLNYTYGRIKTDSSNYPLDHIPPLFGKTALNWKKGNWHSECSVLYNGWKRLKDYNLLGEDNQVYATEHGSPSWWTLNFRTSYQIHKTLQLQVAIENIFDTYYRVFASGISGPGRNIIATIRYNY